MGERLLRASIYESSWMLAHPATLAAVQRPVARYFIKLIDWLDRDNRRLLAEMQQLISNYVQQNYPCPENRIRARTIELAVNDIVARGTDDKPTKIRVKFQPNEGVLEGWGKRWHSQLNPEAD